MPTHEGSAPSRILGYCQQDFRHCDAEHGAHVLYAVCDSLIWCAPVFGDMDIHTKTVFFEA
jgi:hypothetical protein